MDFAQTGLDKTVAYIGLIMENKTPELFHAVPLPEGYAFTPYQPGMEKDWCRIQLSVGHVDTLEQAEEIFKTEFLPFPALLEQNMVFVLAPDKSPAAVGCIWPGQHFGKRLMRLHWIAVSSEHQNKGLSKALLSRLMERYAGCNDGNHYVYLTTQTWSYKAISVYRHFGFTPYLGPQPVGWEQPPLLDNTGRVLSFEEACRRGFALAEEKYRAYQNRKNKKEGH